MYVLLCCYDFVVKEIKMDVGKSKIVCSGNNGYDMSQEKVIKFWVALHPSFPNSYSV